MLSQLSVKKPYTVLVAVVLVLVLGVISFTGMTTDLLPEMELPYIIVMTTYPGASPEKIEMTVTKPLESVLGTTGGVKNVQSVSSENVSMVILEFEQGTNMDSAMIEMSGNIDLVEGQLDDLVGAPMLLKISPDMLPVMVASVDVTGMNAQEISAYVEEDIMPAFERLDGVASVEATGLVEQQISITLNEDKIQAINDRVLGGVDSTLADAQQELRDGQASVADGQAKIKEGEEALASQKDSGIADLASASAQVDAATAQVSALLSEETTLTANQAAFTMEKEGYQTALDTYNNVNAALAAAQTAAVNTAIEMVKAQTLEAVQAMNPAITTYEDAVLFLTSMGQPAPDLDAVSAAAAAAVPGSVADLLAMSPDAFEAFKQQAAAAGNAEMGEMTQESLVQLKAAADAAPARIAAIDVELQNITTRMAVVTSMKPQLEAALAQATSGYEQLESGKMQAIGEITKGEVTLETTKTQLDEAEQTLKDAQEQFNDARDDAYAKADLSGVLTQDMISNILMAQNFNMPAGYLSDGNEQYLVKVGDEFGSLEELQGMLLMNIDIEGVGDIYLRDVATIAMTDNAGESYAKVNGNDAIVLTFQKQSIASTADVADKLNDLIGTLQEGNAELRITPLMDQGDYINMIISSVLSNLLWGGVLAVLILLLFLKDIKPTLIVACSIPFSLLFAITLMYFSGVTLNIISLSGLALGVGMLVDNSIVVIENIYRLRNEGVSAFKAAIRGATQVAGAIFASTLTTICVFLPIIFAEGMARDLFTDMGLTIAYSLLASLIVALTLVPAMGSSMLRNTKDKEHKWFDKFVNAYEKVLRWSLLHKLPVLAGAIALLVFSIFSITQMGTAFIPAMDSPQMSATVTLPKEATTDETYEMADLVLQRMTSVDGVETVGAMEGGGMMSMMSTGGGSGGSSITYYILLSEDRNVSNLDVKQEIEKQVSDLNCTVEVQESTMDMSMLGGSGIELQIYGTDLDEMNAIAADLRGILRNTEGTIDISEDGATGNPETRIVVNKDKAMREGLTVAQIYSEISAATTTEKTATTLTVGTDDFPVVVIKDEEAVPTRENIMDYTFKVTGQDGEEKTIRLSEIADKYETNSVGSISRSNNVRVMSVTAGVDEEHNVGLVSRELEKELEKIELPEGYSVEVLGESENINSTMFELVKMIALAIVFIYLIMVAQFQSLMSPFIVMFTIPLAFTGGLLALLLTGQELSIIAMLGFLVLAGVVVNNGIVFVDSINQLRLEGMKKTAAILQTGRTRIRPVLMTAMTTILAMSTMALGIGDGAEMTQPMAIVTIGGLAYATVLTLVIVPILYDIMMRRKMHKPELDDAAQDAAREVSSIA